MDSIRIRGARIHNLKNLNLEIPKGQIITITGVSGSGKSSLAFDIIFEEGMRRYLQSIGLPQRIEKEKPFDLIEGLSPTIAVEQRTTRIVNPRSTLGTKTNIYTLLRHLFALESRKLCPLCLLPVEEDLICLTCGMKATNLEIKHFSFNEPSGMCLECKGRGYIQEYKVEKIIPDPSKNLLEILKGGSAAFGDMTNFTIALAENMGFEVDNPFNTLPQEVQDVFLYGTTKKMKLKWKSRRFEGTIETKYEGIIPHLERAMAKSTSAYRRNKIEKNFMTKTTCPACQGQKLNDQARNAVINGRNIAELAEITMAELIAFLENLDNTHLRTTQGRALKAEIIIRLKRSELVGISYLSLNRSMATLSGGETQKQSLMTHLDAGLDSVIFILDEPSMGMHELEKNNLIAILKEIKEQGNTVIIVEHDSTIISDSDVIIDLGPGPGVLGGEIVYQGTINGIKNHETSLTGKYLKENTFFGAITSNKKRNIDLDDSKKILILKEVNTNNLKNVEVKIPLSVMIGIAGVSGSGKSSLISDTLVPLLREHFTKRNGDEEEQFIQIDNIKGRLSGWNNISDCVVITQSPIGRVATSNPVSYVGIWDNIRRLFAKQPLAKERSYTPGHFSFNSDKGRCPKCKGSGQIDLEISFFTKVNLPCEECESTGYKQEILDIKFKEKNIRDILNLTVTESLKIFQQDRTILNHLKTLDDIGMGYITLGQPSTTLSGGEAQRIKLARELGRQRKNDSLYVLDEPTTGLHNSDIQKLMNLLEKLVDRGNTVIIIEHDLDVLSVVDYIIELGPEGGPKGGIIIATGKSEDIKKQKKSKIAPFLYSNIPNPL